MTCTTNSCTGVFSAGATVTLTALPGSGASAQFKRWEGAPLCTTGALICNVVMPVDPAASPVTVTAVFFHPVTVLTGGDPFHSLSFTSDPPGLIDRSPHPSVGVWSGAFQIGSTLTVTSNGPVTWSGCAATTATTCTVTVTRNQTIGTGLAPLRVMVLPQNDPLFSLSFSSSPPGVVRAGLGSWLGVFPAYGLRVTVQSNLPVTWGGCDEPPTTTSCLVMTTSNRSITAALITP